MKYITLQRLEKHGACHNQRVLFQSVFGKKAELTPANLKKARDAGLHTQWLANLLPWERMVKLLRDDAAAFHRYECGHRGYCSYQQYKTEADRLLLSYLLKAPSR